MKKHTATCIKRHEDGRVPSPPTRAGQGCAPPGGTRTQRRSHLRIIASIAMAALLVMSWACSDNNPRPTASLTTVIDAEGGELQLPDGTRLVIPEGATGESIEVTLDQVGDLPDPASYLVTLGRATQVDFHGAHLAVPATLKLPYSEHVAGSLGDPFAASFGDGGDWLPSANRKLEQGRLVVEVTETAVWQPATWDIDGLVQRILGRFEPNWGSIIESDRGDGCANDQIILDDDDARRFLAVCIESSDEPATIATFVNRRSFGLSVAADPVDSVLDLLPGTPFAPGEVRTATLDHAGSGAASITLLVTPDWLYSTSDALLQVVDLVPGTSTPPGSEARERLLARLATNQQLITAALYLAADDAANYGITLEEVLRDREVAEAIAAENAVIGADSLRSVFERLDVGEIASAVVAASGHLREGPGTLSVVDVRVAETSDVFVESYLGERGLTGGVIGRADATGDGVRETFVHARNEAMCMPCWMLLVFSGEEVLYEGEMARSYAEVTGACLRVCETSGADFGAPGFIIISQVKQDDDGGNCCPYFYRAQHLLWSGSSFVRGDSFYCMAREVTQSGITRTGSGGPDCTKPLDRAGAGSRPTSCPSTDESFCTFVNEIETAIRSKDFDRFARHVHFRTHSCTGGETSGHAYEGALPECSGGSVGDTYDVLEAALCGGGGAPHARQSVERFFNGFVSVHAVILPPGIDSVMCGGTLSNVIVIQTGAEFVRETQRRWTALRITEVNGTWRVSQLLGFDTNDADPECLRRGCTVPASAFSLWPN
jgi:hypothetical protein